MNTHFSLEHNKIRNKVETSGISFFIQFYFLSLVEPAIFVVCKETAQFCEIFCGSRNWENTRKFRWLLEPGNSTLRVSYEPVCNICLHGTSNWPDLARNGVLSMSTHFQWRDYSWKYHYPWNPRMQEYWLPLVHEMSSFSIWMESNRNNP